MLVGEGCLVCSYLYNYVNVYQFTKNTKAQKHPVYFLVTRKCHTCNNVQPEVSNILQHLPSEASDTTI